MQVSRVFYLFFLISFFAGCSFSAEKKVEMGLLYNVAIVGEKNPGMSLIERMSYYHTPGVSIAIINNGKLAWAKGYGYTSFKPDKQKVTTKTLFQAASISKSFTAIGVLILVQQGKLSLDEDVNNYLTSWKIPDNEFTKNEKVTLRRLLSHTAGITPAGFAGYSVNGSIPSLLDILDGKKPANSQPIRVVKTPGKEFSYSSKGTVIVQQIIEDVTGEPFALWMKKNVLIPFGMHKSTFMQPLSAKYAARAAHGYNQGGIAVESNWYIFPELAPAGLWSTPTELAHFLTTLLGIMRGKREDILSQKLVQEAFTPQVYRADGTGVGLGFYIRGKGKGISFGHGGANPGYLANMRIYPELNKGWVFMLDNRGAQGLAEEIERSIAKAYGIPGYEPIKKTIVKIDGSLLPQYAGTYKDQSAPAHTITITVSDNKLFLLDSYVPSHKIQLYYEGNNKFFAQEQILSIAEDYEVAALQFVADHGKIDTLLLLDKEGEKLINEDTGNEIILKKEAGTIILLNGTSSAGKTSIVRAFQKISGNSYGAIIGDEFVETYAQHHPIDESRRDEANYQILKAMFAKAKQLADSGKNVLIDTVEFDKHYEEYCAILDCNRVVKVLVYCPLDILIERVAIRKRSGDPKEDRPLNLSFGQFTDIYKLQELPNEMVVDRIKTSRMRKALDVAKQEVRQLMKEAGVKEEEFERNLKLFSQPLEDQYKLNELEEIVLVPKHKWNLIVNCVNAPDAIAKEIAKYLNLGLQKVIL